MPMDNHNAILYNQHQQLTHVRALRAHDGLAPVPGMAENERASAIVMGRPPPTHTSPAGPAGPRGPGQQPNGSGAPHPQMPGSAPPQQPHVPQPPSFNGVPPGQRPMSMNGPPQPQPPNGQQQRPVGTPNHNLPFQSPTMSHSPNGQQGPRPPSQQAPGPGPQGAPMANLNGPSPVMNRSMMPPNSIPQGLVMGGTPQPPQQGGPGPQGGNFGQMGGGRPPSRTNTPQMQPGMTHQSPSMGNRQPMPQLEAIESEFRQINPSLFPQLKQDASIPAEKNQNHFSYDDKRKIIDAYKMRYKGPGTPGPPSATASTSYDDATRHGWSPRADANERADTPTQRQYAAAAAAAAAETSGRPADDGCDAGANWASRTDGSSSRDGHGSDGATTTKYPFTKSTMLQVSCSKAVLQALDSSNSSGVRNLKDDQISRLQARQELLAT
ncbi:hypothetical protein FA13DRAFT_1525725 [Coprinellus micaceus]|uniref:Uncharacterized protein n=1 Tax=Coprinellus micaceus TaxID=71717 RepID=A0A4Y7SJ87_COPMI|nr:hypothetical protein FA13DRAFT_1525725 [Coprinellus micaceus]